MSVENKLYGKLNEVLREEGDGENAILYGDGGKPHLFSKGKNGAIVISVSGQENVVLPNSEQIVVKSS